MGTYSNKGHEEKWNGRVVLWKEKKKKERMESVDFACLGGNPPFWEGNLENTYKIIILAIETQGTFLGFDFMKFYMISPNKNGRNFKLIPRETCPRQVLPRNN